ncbi:MAG: hypothetical protein H6735_34150, partial [Alphaproteobacteria bacterium]|nr:hypothetical protein [Alphaproteobacteria bacterium]
MLEHLLDLWNRTSTFGKSFEDWLVARMARTWSSRALLMVALTLLLVAPQAYHVLFQFPEWQSLSLDELPSALLLFLGEVSLVSLFAGCLALLPRMLGWTTREVPNTTPDRLASLVILITTLILPLVMSRMALPSNPNAMKVSSIIQASMVLGTLAALWLLALARLRMSEPPQSSKYGKGREVAALVVAAVAPYLLLLPLEVVIPRSSVLTWRAYSIAGTFTLAYHLVLAGILLDRVATNVLARVAVVTSATIVLLHGLEHTPVQPAEPISMSWTAQLDQRVAEARPGPVIVLAAAGGGTRAAAFALLAERALERTPDPLAEGHTMIERVVLVSSVSGGSLGAIHYNYRRLPCTGQSGYRWRNVFVSDLMRRREGALPLPWTLEEPCVDEMFTSFTAPIVRGILYPG